MLKHAFMAFSQAWRHGLTKAQVRGGLEQMSVADLQKFHRAFYHPKNLVLVLVGGFEPDVALRLVKEHLGIIQSPDIKTLAEAGYYEPIAWDKVPKQMTVGWDSKVKAVCIAFPPPEDDKDRLVLSFWGALLMQRLMTDGEIQRAADAVLCSNPMWSVGVLPFFIYATAKPQVSLSQLQRLLTTRLQRIVAQKPSEVEMAQVRMMITEFTQEPPLSWDVLRQQARQLAAQMGLDAQQAKTMVLGNLAIQLGIRELLLGADASQKVPVLQALAADDLHRLLKQMMDPSKQFVTVLEPMGQETLGG